MIPRTVQRAAAVALASLALPAGAQEIDPALGAAPLEVTEDGRLTVQSGEARYSCALAPGEAAITLADCRLIDHPLADLTEGDWRERVRRAMLDNECRISTLAAIGDAVEAEAVAAGVAAERIAAARIEIGARVEEAVDRMLREGLLSMRGGEFALADCP